MKVLHTIGHGTLTSRSFTGLVRSARLTEIIDIRAFPGSRRNPQFGTEEMARRLPADDIAYTWMRDLGGRRAPVRESKHVALRNPSFQAYADYMESDQFLAAVDEVLAGDDTSAVMCSESVWWRCHRRLLADHLTLVHGVEILHLMHDGRITHHPPTEGVRSAGDRVIYDVGGARPAS